jgi:hypothetical protein
LRTMYVLAAERMRVTTRITAVTGWILRSMFLYLFTEGYNGFGPNPSAGLYHYSTFDVLAG